jgi:flagellar motor component MotA
MEANNKIIEKKSLLELNNDFKEFQRVKNNFLEKYLRIISGVKVEHYRTNTIMFTEIEIVFDAEAKEKLYE